MNRHSVCSIVCLVLGRFSVLVCSVPALLCVTSLQSHWKWEDCILSGMLRIGPCCVLVEVCFGALACLVLCSPVLWGTEQGTSPLPCVGKWTPGLGCTLCLSPFAFVILRQVLAKLLRLPLNLLCRCCWHWTCHPAFAPKYLGFNSVWNAWSYFVLKIQVKQSLPRLCFLFVCFLGF